MFLRPCRTFVSVQPPGYLPPHNIFLQGERQPAGWTETRSETGQGALADHRRRPRGVPARCEGGPLRGPSRHLMMTRERRRESRARTSRRRPLLLASSLFSSFLGPMPLTRRHLLIVRAGIVVESNGQALLGEGLFGLASRVGGYSTNARLLCLRQWRYRGFS